MLISIAILSVFSLHCPLFLFCLSCYLHLSLFSLSRTLIWKEGALLPTQYVLFLPAALSCWTPPQDPALLDKTQGIHAFLFCFISIYRLRRRSTLSRPEGEKGKLIPIQRVVKVWWMSALKQHDSGGGVIDGWHWIWTVLFCFCRKDLDTWAQDQWLFWCEYYKNCSFFLSFRTSFLSLKFILCSKFQGGNGSSPVRGLPSVRRSPQNSHSAPGSIVSIWGMNWGFTKVECQPNKDYLALWILQSYSSTL